MTDKKMPPHVGQRARGFIGGNTNNTGTSIAEWHTRTQAFSPYSTLQAAVALAGAVGDHLEEELSMRRAGGRVPVRDLAHALAAARSLHARLAVLAAQEGGQ
jgi:hypothetical protein